MAFFQTPRGELEIRELRSHAEMTTAEILQRKVWGPDIIPHPKEMLIPVQHEGGLLAGAFTTSQEMVGLIFGFPTKDASVQHSQMLATLEEWRGAGIGTRLKWFQRDWCLERGIHLVRWTVDPLRAPNADLNIRHLGATAATYLVDYYGPMLGIDAGAPTDRLLVEWHLTSQRVISRVKGVSADLLYPQAGSGMEASEDLPGQVHLDLDCRMIRIPIPRNFIQITQTDPGQALEWRLRTRTCFLHFFECGYSIVDFSRADGPAYILERSQAL
jgi:chorismate synthase